MTKDKKRREGSTLKAVLDLGWGLLQIGWMALRFLSALAVQLLPEKAAAARVPESGREADHPMESAADVERHERWGTMMVLCSFTIAIAGGVAFLVFFWKGATTTALLGGSLAVFLGGMAFTLVLWARWMMIHKEAVEPRHILPSSVEEREDTAEAFCGGAREIRRRQMLRWMAVGAGAVFASMVATLFRSLGLSPYPSLFTRVWTRGQRLVTADGVPVTLSSLEPGSMVTVFPEDSIGSERAQTILIRIKEAPAQAPAVRSGWAQGGYVAYSRICTHAGCPVAEFEAEQSILLCPCHQSTFDVLRAAKPVGGPAGRALPQLPLYAAADGTLRAGGGFTAPPGPGFWGI